MILIQIYFLVVLDVVFIEGESSFVSNLALGRFISVMLDFAFIENTKRLLKGEFGFMCQYDDEPDFKTVWSSIYDLRGLIIYHV